MSDFRPAAPTYRAQVRRVWDWWRSLCAKPQLWGVYAVFCLLAVLDPTPNALYADHLVRPLGTVGAIISMLMVLRNWRRARTRMTRPGDRGQLTIPDMVFFGAALVIIAGLAEPIYDLLNQQAGELGTGAGYLLQMVVPGLLITLLIIFFAIASGGGQ